MGYNYEFMEVGDLFFEQTKNTSKEVEASASASQLLQEFGIDYINM